MSALDWIFAIAFTAVTVACALIASCVKEEAPWPFHYMAVWWAAVAGPAFFWWSGALTQ